MAALRDRALVRTLADLGLRVGEGLALDVEALGYLSAHSLRHAFATAARGLGILML